MKTKLARVEISETISMEKMEIPKEAEQGGDGQQLSKVVNVADSEKTSDISGCGRRGSSLQRQEKFGSNKARRSKPDDKNRTK